MKPCFAFRQCLSIALVLGYCCAAIPALGQTQAAWVARYDGGRTVATNEAVAMMLDPAGNIIVSGNLTKGTGPTNYLVLKYAPTGTLLWVRTYASGGTTHDAVRGMAVDPQGNVFVTGTSVTAKYSPNGTLLWTVPYGGRAIAVDTNGNSYVTGYSDVDLATVKLDSTGSNLWLRAYDQIGQADMAQTITLARTGDVVVCGVSECYVDPRGVRQADVTTIRYTAAGEQLWVSHSYECLLYGGAFYPEFWSRILGLVCTPQGGVVFMGHIVGLVTKEPFRTTALDTAGNHLWTYQWHGSIVYSKERGMAMDAAGRLYLVGAVTPLPISATTVYGTIKLDTNGNETWIRRYGDAQAGYHFANAIALDTQGNPYVTGLSPGPTGTNDIATIKYDPDGQEIWVQRYNGPFNGDDQAAAIAVDPSGAVYVAGFSQASPTLTELVVIKYAELKNIQILEDGAARLQFFGAPGSLCRFLAATNFPDWQEIGTATAGPDGICRFDDTNAPSFRYRFYRAVP